MTLECPYCGYENRDDVVWCAKCNHNMVNWSSGEVRSASDTARDTDSGDDVSDHLWMSVLITLFCCQILGVIAIIYSVIARIEKERGNREHAVSASSKASAWIGWAFGTGIVGWIILLFAPPIIKTINCN